MMKFLVFLMVLFSGFVQADILFQDPTGKGLNTAINSLSKEEVKGWSRPGSGREEFFLGLFYIRGAPEFSIQKDCKKSIDFLRSAWGEGVADAGYTLATMYYNGICTAKDVSKARDLATQTAQEGYVLAQRMLGMAYVGKKWQNLYSYDVEKGICWLAKAGNAGDRESAAQLALMYNRGVGVVKDDKKYFFWLKKAVFNKFEEGNRLGFPALAESYESGKGTEKNLVKAYKYFDLSGTAGVKGKKRIAKEMTQEQIDEALRQSKKWQEEHNVQVGGGFIRRAN
ncbi:tetratricopeptide repeat protein [Salinicola sp. CPA57]|uniref:tetratricopeptide repeat protein n=1 Tax=Salinicola sp. CPA57 TaxID=1949080 RepID=UPI000DA1506B|nr:tetratricopeptide repeat protein [Salinicola sp. CPA57]